MFDDLLISTCTIETKALSQSGYEKVAGWTPSASDVPCRKDSDNGAKISDGDKRLNINDDIFFLKADVVIKRGNRILFDSEYYDVIKVNKLYDELEVHHLEVIARYVDNS